MAQDGTSHRLDRLARVEARLEDRRARDDEVGTRGGRGVDGLGREAAVDLDVEIGILRAKCQHLGHHGRLELLTPKARLYGHDEHHVDELDDAGEHLHSGTRLDRDAHLHAVLADQFAHLSSIERVIAMAADRLNVKGVARAAGLGDVRHPLGWFAHHQVAIEESIGHVLAQ